MAVLFYDFYPHCCCNQSPKNQKILEYLRSLSDQQIDDLGRFIDDVFDVFVDFYEGLSDAKKAVYNDATRVLPINTWKKIVNNPELLDLWQSMKNLKNCPIGLRSANIATARNNACDPIFEAFLKDLFTNLSKVELKKLDSDFKAKDGLLDAFLAKPSLAKAWKSLSGLPQSFRTFDNIKAVDAFEAVKPGSLDAIENIANTIKSSRRQAFINGLKNVADNTSLVLSNKRLADVSEIKKAVNDIRDFKKNNNILSAPINYLCGGNQFLESSIGSGWLAVLRNIVTCLSSDPKKRGFVPKCLWECASFIEGERDIPFAAGLLDGAYQIITDIVDLGKLIVEIVDLSRALLLYPTCHGIGINEEFFKN